MNGLEYLAPGVKVAFGYYHSLNSRSKVYREKQGVVIRTVKHRKGTVFNQPEAVVQLEGNARPRSIELSRLRVIGSKHE